MSETDDTTQPLLEATLLASMEQDGMFVCVKDANKKVLRQNERCKTLCGDLEGEFCYDGCMEIFAADANQQWHNWGNRTYRNSFLHNSYYDVTLLCSENYLVTILQSLDDKHAHAVEYYRQMGLSKREMEVITEVIKGNSNTLISEQLTISMQTLRTHLNNIYSKVDQLDGSLAYLPQSRQSRA